MRRSVDSRLPPGPALPRAVQTLEWYVRPTRFLERCHDEHGEIFTVRLVAQAMLGPRAEPEDGTWVLVTNPAHVKEIFTGDPSLMRSPTRFLEPVLGPNSVFIVEEPRHLAQRKALLPAFHGERIAHFEQLIADATQEEIRRWPIGVPFELLGPMKDISLEVILRAMFASSDPGWQAEMRERVLRMVHNLTHPPRIAAVGLIGLAFGAERAERSRWLRGAVTPVDEMVVAEIRRRRAAGSEADDILGMLLDVRYEDGSALSDRELRDQLMTLIVAGHETTGNTLGWAFERIIRHPEVLADIRAELGSGRSEVLDAAIKESMRLRPVIPMAARKLGAPLQIAGYEVPAGGWVGLCGYLLHRREDVYPDPLEFRPERFMGKPPGTYTWLPFGGGPRRCLGVALANLELRTIVQTVLRELDVRPAEPEGERTVRRLLALTPAGGAKVVLSRRRAPAATAAPVGELAPTG
jgi:cytochrome P450